MSKSKNQATRASAADLKSLAAQGVARALEARAGLTELSADQVQQVSGGATTLYIPFKYGVWPDPIWQRPGGIVTLPGGFNPVVGP
ncbi:hypothetical protein BurJ1DRAFT_3794 [Burkholderiales bacterium JOSHI_001]|nr:hypothetical protein BurJ1DRAFT_3794 [Burkholderiales bacterium JOSHI_001]